MNVESPRQKNILSPKKIFETEPKLSTIKIDTRNNQLSIC